MSRQINLFNPLFLKQEKVFSAVTLMQGFLIIVLGSLALSTYAIYNAGEIQKIAKLTEVKLQTAEKQIKQLREQHHVKEKNPAIEMQVQTQEQALAAKQEVIQLLTNNDFGDTQGFSAYLSAFARQIPDGVWLTGFYIGTTQAQPQFTLQGRTLQGELVPQFVSNLKKETIMNGRSFAQLEMQTPRETEQKIENKTDKKSEGDSKNKIHFLEFELRSIHAESNVGKMNKINGAGQDANQAMKAAR
jgi:Tfp pilus assembly protein PilN